MRDTINVPTIATVIFAAEGNNQLLIQVDPHRVYNAEVASRCFDFSTLNCSTVLPAVHWLMDQVETVDDHGAYVSSSIDFAREEYGWTRDAHEVVEEVYNTLLGCLQTASSL